MTTTVLLRCPVCLATLDVDFRAADDAVECGSCGARHEWRHGVLDLTPPDVADDPAWESWRAHLDAFQDRREHRQSRPTRLPARLSVSGKSQQEAFAAFTGIRDGVVVDVGCGPGKFSKHLPQSVEYVGLDPIPIPELPDLRMIRGVAEHLPFADGSVRHVTVLSALDHFNDVGAFLAEVTRILGDGGRLHVIQQVHEPRWSLRGIAHEVKDAIDDRSTDHDPNVPHHMNEYDDGELRRQLTAGFTIEREELFSVRRFAPRRLFLTLAPA